MISEYERYHGLVIRDIVVSSGRGVSFCPVEGPKRVNSFIVDNSIGLYIKHSSKRLPPWPYTFTDDCFGEIASLQASCTDVCVALVCGGDGSVCLSYDELDLVTKNDVGAVRFVRVDRDRRTMYRVFGNAGRLPSVKPRGVQRLIDALNAALPGNTSSLTPGLFSPNDHEALTAEFAHTSSNVASTAYEG